VFDMQKVRFGIYYSQLIMRVAMRMSATTLPMDLVWRWNYWQRRIGYQGAK